ncbi:LacI family DNA-binding transcriptional regulator [Lacticaseibacillus chiayiensis]|uniref:LacI family DNA-binding transcriptional regulator n=1 Tax=Lacticaseibacillus chiayiensis TaxID=2100821 RepID=UPI001304D164|nr:LacI family DNA-binding transcriptional regulator [Lacticaseibacillus chiayiensis]
MKLTITDVAEKAGVSKATISRYLNGRFEHMSAATKAHIAAVIAELNYTPSPQASSLKTNRSHLIGVVVADISNIYSTLLISGINKVTQQSMDQILINDAANDLKSEAKALEMLLSMNVDGIIMQPLSPVAHHYDLIRDSQTPMVLVDRITRPLTWPTVTADDYRSTAKLARAILKSHYDDILILINPIAQISTRQSRYQAFVDTFKTTPTTVTLLETSSDSIAPLANWITAHPQKHPLIFAGNGRLLMATLRWLHDKGLRIPQDVALSGYDDWDWAELVTPGISAVSQHPDVIGQTAAELLAQQIAGEPVAVQRMEIPADVRIRSSF